MCHNYFYLLLYHWPSVFIKLEGADFAFKLVHLQRFWDVCLFVFIKTYSCKPKNEQEIIDE